MTKTLKLMRHPPTRYALNNFHQGGRADRSEAWTVGVPKWYIVLEYCARRPADTNGGLRFEPRTTENL